MTDLMPSGPVPAELVPARTVDRVPRPARVPLPPPPSAAPASRSTRTPTGGLRILAIPPPVETYLAPGEVCRIRVRLHWLVPLRAFAKGLVMMPLAIALTLALNFVASGVWWLQAGLWLATFTHQAWLFYRVLLWRAEQITVTDTRIARCSGVFTLRVDEVRLAQITDSNYRQTLAGRVLNYGSIRIESAGDEQDIEQLHFVPNPAEFYRALWADTGD